MAACPGGSHGSGGSYQHLKPMTTTSFSHAMPEAGFTPAAAARARQAALVGLLLMVAAVEFSIAVAQIFLALTLVAWTSALVIERRRPSVPSWALPLAIFAVWTLVSAAFSADRVASLVDSKQLVLLLI